MDSLTDLSSDITSWSKSLNDDTLGLVVLGGFLLFIGFGCFLFVFGRGREIKNFRTVADALGLTFEARRGQSASAWGVLADARRINLYTKYQARVGYRFRRRQLPYKMIPTLDVGIEGIASDGLSDNERVLFWEYAHRAFPEAMEPAWEPLRRIGPGKAEIDEGVIRCRDIRLMAKTANFVDAVEAVVAAAQKVEADAVAELRGSTARHHARDETTAEVSQHPSDDEYAEAPGEYVYDQDDEPQDDGPPLDKRQSDDGPPVDCPHCGAKTPRSRPTCQMCDAPIAQTV